MSEYKVWVYGLYRLTVIVEADSTKDALEKVKGMLNLQEVTEIKAGYNRERIFEYA